MRTLTANTQNKVDTKLGVNPVVVVKLGSRYYGTYEDTSPVFVSGRIKDVSAVKYSVKQNYSGAIGSVSLTFIDTDNLAKNTLDDGDFNRNIDCIVYYHFYGNNLSDLVPILRGYVAEPISWNEGDRTFTFDIVSSYQEKTCGYIFDPDDFIGDSIITSPDERARGSLWPIVFGKVNNSPLLKIQQAPRGYLDINVENTANTSYMSMWESFPQGESIEVFMGGVLCDVTLDKNSMGLTTLNKPILEAATKSKTAAAAGYNKVQLRDEGQYLAGRFVTVTAPSGDTIINFCTSQYGTICTFAIDFMDRGRPLDITTDTLTAYGAPIQDTKNLDLLIEIMGDTLDKRRLRYFDDGSFTILAGAYVYLNVPTIYAAGYYQITGLQDVLIKDGDSWVAFPELGYNLRHITLPTGIAGSIIEFNEPLEPLGFGDGAVATMESSKGNNSATAIETLFDEFTSYTTGSTFATVASEVAKYYANFTITEPMDVISLCEDIAWQSRCAIVIKATNTVEIYYLSKEPSSVFEIDKSKVEANTMVFNYTDVYDVSANFIGVWRPSILHDEQMTTYKETDPTTDTTKKFKFWIYNIEDCVAKSLEFWGKRLSTLWTYMTVKTFHRTLALELHDCVSFDLNDSELINDSVKGIVEQINYDFQDDGSITLDIWLPVEAGS